MKRIIAVLLSISISMSSLLLGGCVTTSTFNKFVAESQKADAILFCESRNDVYEDLVNSDEPDPTRRDEPSGTRRDLAACEAEFVDIAGGNAQACKADMVICSSGTTNTIQACRGCFIDCLNSGSWDAGICPE